MTAYFAEMDHADRNAQLEVPKQRHPHRLTDAATALEFVTAGNARFTILSLKTGKRFTFRTRRSEDKSVLFVSLLIGADNENDFAYQFVLDGKTLAPRMTRKSPHELTAAHNHALIWVLGHLVNGRIPPVVEFWHEGKCGRCNRALTDPVSIERGIGPECIKRMSAAA